MTEVQLKTDYQMVDVVEPLGRDIEGLFILGESLIPAPHTSILVEIDNGV